MPPQAWSSAERVPTLTEVVELDSVFPSTQVPVDESGLWLGEPAAAEAASVPVAAPLVVPVSAPEMAAALSAEVLFELEQRIGSVLDARLREALAPALARAADALIQDARLELAQTLRALVDESVTRALERRTNL